MLNKSVLVLSPVMLFSILAAAAGSHVGVTPLQPEQNTITPLDNTQSNANPNNNLKKLLTKIIKDHDKHEAANNAHIERRLAPRPSDIKVDVKYSPKETTPAPLFDALTNIYDGLNEGTQKHAYQAMPISDKAYGTRFFSSLDSPYVPISLHSKVRKEKSCEKGFSHPCIVIENDSFSGKMKHSYYYLFTDQDPKDLNIDYIHRVEIDSNKFSAQLNLLDHSEGIHVYSGSNGSQAAPEPDYTPKKQEPFVYVPSEGSSRFCALSKNTKFEGVAEQDRASHCDAVDKMIEEHTVTLNPGVGYGPAQCWVTMTMVPEHRFVLIDFKSLLNFGSESKVYSRVSSSAHISCYLVDGKTLQYKVPVKIKEWGLFRFGIGLDKSKQMALTFGVGFANDVRELLARGDKYFYLTRASAGLGPFEAGIKPVTVSGAKNFGAILAVTPEATVSFDSFRFNGDITAFGGMTIEADLSAPQSAQPAAASNSTGPLAGAGF